MDCQVMMGLFVFVYYWTFVRNSVSLNSVYSQYNLMDGLDQIKFYQMIQTDLLTNKLINAAGQIIQTAVPS
jgi:hypothetical protein